jgi:molybdopterin-guanine dinucleotide biosynthesis protein A
MIDIPCVILSGGKSIRMGEDKSLLPFGEYSTLIEYQYKKLSKIFSKVYISSKIDKFDFLNNKDQIIYDVKDVSSPMVALQSILKKFKNQKIFIITVDTPLILKETIEDLLLESDNNDITIACSKNRTHNLCGIFKSNLSHKIDIYIEEKMHKINFLVKNSQTKYKEFDDEDQFININTPNEYQKAKLI